MQYTSNKVIRLQDVRYIMYGGGTYNYLCCKLLIELVLYIFILLIDVCRYAPIEMEFDINFYEKQFQN
jgi:hypothetical protein